MTDLELVARARQGDAEAFLQLVKPHERQLYYIAVGMVTDAQEAEDVWQNTVLRAWQGIRKLRKPESFRQWLTRLLFNEAKRSLRKRKLAPTPLAVLPERLVPRAEVEEYLLIHACLQRLPEKQRQAVMLRYWLDMSLQEIGEALGVPLSTAKTRLYQGVASLKVMLQEGEVDKNE